MKNTLFYQPLLSIQQRVVSLPRYFKIITIFGTPGSTCSMVRMVPITYTPLLLCSHQIGPVNFFGFANPFLAEIGSIFEHFVAKAAPYLPICCLIYHFHT
jgi:hypothetical protein